MVLSQSSPRAKQLQAAATTKKKDDSLSGKEAHSSDRLRKEANKETGEETGNTRNKSEIKLETERKYLTE